MLCCALAAHRPGARHADVFHGGKGYNLEQQKAGYDGVADWINARL